MLKWLISSLLAGLIFGCSGDVGEAKTHLVDKYEYLDSLDKAVAEKDEARQQKQPNDTIKETKTNATVSWKEVAEIDGVNYTKLSWANLADVTFKEKFYEEVNAYFLFPEFGTHIKALDGSPVILQGYLVPIPGGEDQKLYALSKNPFSACFFCGNAGPETVAELELEDPEDDLKLDKVYTFKGILSLNAEDINRMNYILTQAESISD